VGKGYAEGPAAEEADRRREELEREGQESPAELRAAVFGATDENPTPHFLGWADEVDADGLFERGEAWGLSTRRIAAATAADRLSVSAKA
jgi:hypothetical protein